MQGPREHGVSGVSCPLDFLKVSYENALKSEFSYLKGKILEDLRSLTPPTFGPCGVPDNGHVVTNYFFVNLLDNMETFVLVFYHCVVPIIRVYQTFSQRQR